jgi:hypothetical protein
MADATAEEARDVQGGICSRWMTGNIVTVIVQNCIDIASVVIQCDLEWLQSIQMTPWLHKPPRAGFSVEDLKQVPLKMTFEEAVIEGIGIALRGCPPFSARVVTALDAQAA